MDIKKEFNEILSALSDKELISQLEKAGFSFKEKNSVYLVWETSSSGEPTGKTRLLNAPNAKWAASHIKYETKGEFLYPTNRCTTVKTPDGFLWYTKFYKKHENRHFI